MPTKIKNNKKYIAVQLITNTILVFRNDELAVELPQILQQITCFSLLNSDIFLITEDNYIHGYSLRTL